MSTVREAFGVASPYASKSFMAGMECEVEDVEQVIQSLGNYWNITDDGSLRNNGHEFISVPMQKIELLQQFDKLHNSIQYYTKDVSLRFSPRTSVHVHVNCLDLQDEQVRSIMLWYALFEPIFFKLVHPSRSNNIHCVALDQTTLSEHYSRPLRSIHQRWSKYSALNLLPLSKYGTIEFRHMEGTDDQEKITEWLNTLENLWKFGQENLLNKKSTINDPIVKSAFIEIFKDSPNALRFASILPSMLSNTIIDVKLSLI